MQAHPGLKQQTEFLRTIRGIAEWSVARVIARGGSALIDRNCRQLAVHAGWRPRLGNPASRCAAKAILPSLGAPRSARPLHARHGCRTTQNRDVVLAEFHQRLLANGKPKKVAIVARMRKLLHLIHSVLKSQTAFNPALHGLLA
jgi:transposase